MNNRFCLMVQKQFHEYNFIIETSRREFKKRNSAEQIGMRLKWVIVTTVICHSGLSTTKQNEDSLMTHHDDLGRPVSDLPCANNAMRGWHETLELSREQYKSNLL